MKTKILILFILCLLFSNCNDDNNTTENETLNIENKLIKKISIKSIGKYENNFSYFEFFYTNGKVSEVLENGTEKNILEYEGDKVVKLSSYSSDNSLLSYVIYSYEGNKFSSQLYNKNGQAEDKFDFFINKNQELYKMVYMDCDEYNYIYNNGNISTETINDKKKLISYDNKFNPFTNYNIYFRIIYDGYLYHTLSKNNPIKTELFWNKTSSTPNISLYEIVYDKDNYPIEVTEKYNDGITEYYFEYTK